MTSVDDFIEELFREGADRLTLVADRPATLSVEGRETTVGPDPMSGETLREMLSGILPNGPDPASARPPRGKHEFTYESPRGAVVVRAYVTDATIRVTMKPEEEARDPAAPRAESRPVSEREPASEPEPTLDPTPEPAGEPVPQAATGSERAAVDRIGAAPDGGPGLERLFRKMVVSGCSDLHVSAGSPPLFRKDGEIVDMDESPLPPERTEELIREIAPERNWEEFRDTNDTDFAHEIPGLARFRCNVFRDRKGVGGVFRQIPAEIMTAEDLGLSDAILDLCELNKGLVVVTGPTGSGKSTTLAALVDYINRTRKAHIITIEDPIEFVHENKKCLINQREVGVHTRSFKVALRAALREDPDIVLVGEMRDLETVEIAMETAETGHLVFGTLHTNTAASTVDRIIDQFPADQQNQIRTMLSESLKAVIAQTLCRKVEGGRVAAMEVLMVTNAVSNLIREGKTFQIPSLMQTGASSGMRTLNDALLDLVREDLVTPREAYRNAVERADFRQALKRHGYALEDLPEPTV